MSKNNKQLRNLGIICVILLILLMAVFYYFMNKESKYSSSTSGEKEIVQRTAKKCLEEQMQCLKEAECTLVFCPEPVTIIDINNKIAKKNNPTPTPSPTQSPTPTPTVSPTPTPTPTETPYEPYMDSENYKIAWDSINSGGELSSSENYSAEDTVGEIATGYSTSEIYLMHAGYQQNDAGEEVYISLAVDYATVVLTTGGNGVGNFLDGITGGIVNAYHGWTVTSNNTNGYTLALKESSGAKTGGGTNGALTNMSDTDYEFLPVSAVTPSPWPSLLAGETGFGYSLSNLTGSATAAADWSGKTDGSYFVGIGLTDYDLLDNSGPSSPSGDGVRVNWKAQMMSGGSKYLKPGLYSEFITITGSTNP